MGFANMSALVKYFFSGEKIAMEYNFMLYFVHYSGHLDQLETMTNLGDITQLSMLELSKHTPGLDAVIPDYVAMCSDALVELVYPFCF